MQRKWSVHDLLRINSYLRVPHGKAEKKIFIFSHCVFFSVPYHSQKKKFSLNRINDFFFVELRVTVYALMWKSKAILVHSWRGPEGSRHLMVPEFLDSRHEVGMVVSPTQRPSLPPPPGDTPVPQFYYWLSPSQGHGAVARIKSMKNHNDPTGNRISDRPSYSAVPHLRYRFIIRMVHFDLQKYTPLRNTKAHPYLIGRKTNLYLFLVYIV
jgi:hypothetical protein